MQYGKHGKAFVLPGMIWPAIVLPPSNTAWIASQPEHNLSSYPILREGLALEYFARTSHDKYMLNFDVIRRDLTRKSSTILSIIATELNKAFAQALGDNAEDFKDVAIFKVIQDSTQAAVTRAFAGERLGSDKRFVKLVRSWEKMFGIVSSIIRFAVPAGLRDWLAPVVMVPIHWRNWQLKRFLAPEIDRRIAAARYAGTTKEVDGQMPKANDFLQWMLDSERTEQQLSGVQLDSLILRMLIINLVGKSSEHSDYLHPLYTTYL
jgi:hypothetical protein